jgi:hypothetical protein
VHPFWPLDNRWYYGDLIFILEPWIWVAILLVVWWRCTTRVGQGIALFLLEGIGAANAITLLGIAWMVAQKFLRDDRLRIAGSFTGTQYRAAAWTAAAWPSIVPATACPSQLRSGMDITPFGKAPAARVPLGEFCATRA